MADLGSACPVEMEKTGSFLHERRNLPRPPARDLAELGRIWFPVALGVLLAMVMVALAFQARATWGAHRDWVVPVTAPLLVVGGLSLGYVVARREWNAAVVPGLLFLILVALSGWDVWLDAQDGSSGLRDALAITNGILLGLVVIASFAALIWVEWRKPTRAPVPEG